MQSPNEKRDSTNYECFLNVTKIDNKCQSCRKQKMQTKGVLDIMHAGS